MLEPLTRAVSSLQAGTASVTSNLQVSGILTSDSVDSVGTFIRKKRWGCPLFCILMCSAAFACPTDFVNACGYRAESFGFIFGGA